jgi:hypothetical protein
MEEDVTDSEMRKIPYRNLKKKIRYQPYTPKGVCRALIHTGETSVTEQCHA